MRPNNQPFTLLPKGLSFYHHSISGNFVSKLIIFYDFMSDNVTKATVELLVNGQNAQSTLNQLRKNALDLESAIAKAASAGNKTDLKRLRKELADTKRQIREIESSTQQVEDVLTHLDKATPRELNRSLQTLNRQLEYIERGSSAWDAHTEKIRRVKEEIARVNDDLRLQEGLWQRMNHTLNDWQTTIMGVAAAITGLIMAGRSAVSAYAEMDDELANVRKFTGMASEQVSELNEEFKQIDTRSSRLEMNKLAEEAGRLGKTSTEDVLGFVKAADQINVALDDLGEGATLTLSKLTNIFGDEERLGTEKALLSVGSVINELSQNCTASAPYLADFAKRMAGVGAQANMTIPQIMAFAAVLDSQGQACEMSATALSKLTMDLFKDTEKVAKAVGIPLQTLKEALDSSTNEGLLMLLQRLHDLGDMSVLAPVFKDMGENGARASQVIAALAGNIDTLKQQQQEAQKAFDEGTSVTKEFNTQNNTVQAGLDKAKKRVSELAIELGEKLLPIMEHVMSSTTLMMKLMNTIADFIIKHKEEIASLTVLISAYAVGVNAVSIYTKAATVATEAWNLVAGNIAKTYKGFTAALVLHREALAGCTVANAKLHTQMLAQNVVTKLVTASTIAMKTAYYAMTLQFKAAGTSLKSLHAVMSANPYGLVLAAIAAVTMAIYKNVQARKEKHEQMLREIEEEREMMKEYRESYAHINMLNKILHDNSKSIDDRRKALNQLKQIVPDYHADLTTEGNLIRDNTEALTIYLEKLRQSAVMKANRDKLEKLYVEQDELQEQERQESSAYWHVKQTNTLQGYDSNSGMGKFNNWLMGVFGVEDTEGGTKTKLDATQTKLAEVNAKIAELEKKVVPEDPQTNNSNDAGSSGSGGGATTSFTPSHSNSSSKEDRFKAEKEWKEREEALNRIAYATGQRNYEDYTKRMDEIAVEFYTRQLSHTDLSENERLSIQAQYYEATKKQSEDEQKQTIQQEKEAYAEKLAALKQNYVDGKITLQVYNDSSQLLELEHLRKMVQITKEGTTERLEAEKAYNDKLIADMKKRQQEVEAAEKQHQDNLKRLKDKYFGDNPQERKAKYDADIALLTEVFNAEIAAAGDNADEKLRIEEAFQQAKLELLKEYNLLTEEENQNFLQSWNENIMAFLETDVGSAIQGGLQTLVSSMSSIFQQLTSLVQAELQIQTNSINKRYDAEVKAAEGNRYKINQIEKKREAETKKAKDEANKKMFAMQVAQAVASTALSAINAYSSAAQVPMIGYILAPIAAAAAIAAGAIQIAAIKKQQEASASQGYMKGGFTPDGRIDEEVGVVHAGEWVASRKLLASPVARPLINALDYAQKTNTIGSLKSEDVSRTITAPTVMAQNTTDIMPSLLLQPSEDDREHSTTDSETLSSYSETMKKLQERLEEPFVTVNTVTGDFGIKQAQDEYDILMRNKSPKSW